MKVAILTESPADQQAARILIEAVLGRPTEPAAEELLTRSWPGPRSSLPTVIKALYYWSECEALAVIVDSNHSPLHLPDHERDGAELEGCRSCDLSGIARATLRTLRLNPGKPYLKVAVGVAVPAIEAWYLCGQSPLPSESSWAQAMETRQYPYGKKALKRAVYGIEHPDLCRGTDRAVEAARRLAKPGMLATLERLFPGGFGGLARAVRAW